MEGLLLVDSSPVTLIGKYWSLFTKLGWKVFLPSANDIFVLMVFIVAYPLTGDGDACLPMVDPKLGPPPRRDRSLLSRYDEFICEVINIGGYSIELSSNRISTHLTLLN